MAAIALSGLSFEKGNAWRVQCKAVRNNIKDPYLRAMFAFLSPDNDPNYEAVLVSKYIFWIFGFLGLIDTLGYYFRNNVIGINLKTC